MSAVKVISGVDGVIRLGDRGIRGSAEEPGSLTPLDKAPCADGVLMGR